MKRILISIFALLLITIPVFAGHAFYNGKVTKISENFLTVDGNVYWIASNCRVVFHDQIKGAFFEKPATLRDVKVGNWVTVAVEGKTIQRIMIERYRK
ncbi:MAG: hypothetical protein AB1638_07540 [Nitrospirota bacterium]